jgi:arylsulfatase A-like enzyme
MESICSRFNIPAHARIQKAFALAVLIPALVLSAAPARAAATTAVKGSPNIVFILSDDLGWGDVGYHGAEFATPTLDQLAKRGVALNRYYTYAVCSPTRAALMSGRSSLETGVDAPIAREKVLPMDAKLLPQYLHDRGYQTVMVGKWHLGQARTEYMPFRRGFDYFYGFLGGFIDHYTHLSGEESRLDWQRNGVSLRETGYSTDLFTTDAIRQIRGRDRSKPLFLYLAYDAPHTPLQAPQDEIDRFKNIADPVRRTYAAMVHHFDAQLARVLETIEAEGMSQDTLIIWASDNGPAPGGGSSSGGLRGTKGTSFEGGQRVPAIAYWPGHISGGKPLESAVTVLDWFPTLIGLAGGTVPTDQLIVGRDVLPVLTGKTTGAQAKMVIGNHSVATGGFYESAYRWPWKALRAPSALVNPESAKGAAAKPSTGSDSRTVMLFDVMADQYEKNDVSAKHPDILLQLVADLDAAPHAKESLSAAGQAEAQRAAAAEAQRSAGASAEGMAGDVIASDLRSGPIAIFAPPGMPGGESVFKALTEERGEPVAEASARASASAKAAK